MPILFDKFVDYYNMVVSGKSINELENLVQREKAQSAEYVDYISWLDKQNKTKAINYWEAFLEGYDSNSEISAMKKPEQTDVQVCEIFGKISTERCSLDLATHWSLVTM